MNFVSCFKVLGADIIVKDKDCRDKYHTKTPIGITGLDNTGTNNCSIILNRLTNSVGLLEGTYLINTDCLLKCDIEVPKGAIFKIPYGVTLTIDGNFTAGRYKVFDLTGGQVKFNSSTVVYPEWFGGGVDVNDNSGAIETAILSGSVISLGKGTYKIGRAISMRSGVKMYGFLGNERTQSDTIICSTTDVSCLIIGGTQDSMIEECYVENICFTTTAISPNAFGVFVRYASACKLTNLRVTNYKDSYYLNHTVYTKVSGCCANCTDVPDSVTCRGFILGDSDGHWNYNGNNASLYFSNNIFIGHSTSNYDIGVYVLGYVSDTYIDHFETVSGRFGILVTLTGEYFRRGQTNLWIRNCVIDAFSDNGIKIEGTSVGGSVCVDNCYISPAFGATIYHACIYVVNNQANVTLTNNQLVNFDPTYNEFYRGVTIENASNVHSTGNNIVNMFQPQVASGNCTNVTFKDYVYNNEHSCGIVCNLEGNIYCADCRNTINGGANMVGSWCYNVSNDCHQIVIDNSGVNRGVLMNSATILKYKDNTNYTQLGLSSDNGLVYYGFN